MASLFHLVPGHSDSTYHDTEGKDSEHGDTPLNRLSMTKNMRSSRRMGCYILTGVVLFLGIFATITMLNVKSIVTTLHSWEESTRALEKPTEDPLKQVWQCGKSKAEAEELKCRFNAVMWAWEPALCFDEELHAAEIAAHEWFYYRTKWMNKVPSEGDRVPIAEVIDGQHERLYSTVVSARSEITGTIRIFKPLLTLLLEPP